MGKLFKDFLKLGAAVQKQKQIEKSAREAREKQELAEKIRAQAKEQSAQWLKIANDCANLVNTTKNPDVFFPRYKLLLENMQKLAGLESTGIFSKSPNLPSAEFLRLEKLFPAATENFIDRSFEEAKEKAATLKTEKAKEDAIALLPQPFVTTALVKNEALKVIFDLNKEWEKLQEGKEEKSALLTGVIVGRKEFIENYGHLYIDMTDVS